MKERQRAVPAVVTALCRRVSLDCAPTRLPQAERGGYSAAVSCTYLIRGRRSREDLQRNDLVALERKDELKLDGTARKISGEPVRHDGLAIFPSDRKRLDSVLVFLLCLGLPLLNRGQTFDCFAFVPHNGISGEALGQGLRITRILGGNIDGDGCWKINHAQI